MIRKKTIMTFSFIFALFLIWNFINDMEGFIVKLPVNSSPHRLTLSRNGVGRFGPEKIILKHYIQGEHICDYELKLNTELCTDTYHKYELPKFEEGSVEVYVHPNLYTLSAVISTTYDAKELYKKGLLIYFSGYACDCDANMHDYPGIDGYTYFVSGGEKRSYVCKAHQTIWKQTEDAPRLKRFVTPQRMTYVPWDDSWKNNRWTVLGKEAVYFLE